MRDSYLVQRILGSVRRTILFAAVLAVFLGVGVLGAFLAAGKSGTSEVITSNAELNLSDGTAIGNQAQKLTVNAQLQINGQFYLAPAAVPQDAPAGTIIFDQSTNSLKVSNGTEFVSILTGQDNVQATGGVASLQGQTGVITLSAGNGISINGTTITNSGILGVNGVGGDVNVTTANGIASVSLPQSIAPSATPNFAGLLLDSPLGVASGGTGAVTFTANGVVIGNGTGALGTVTANIAGQCLISTAGAPVFGACAGGGAAVDSLNGLTGNLTLANASGVGTTITINNASTAAKGIAQFNSTNFSVVTGNVNTIQNIATTSSPTFAGLTLSSPLTVANGGTGRNSLTNNAVLVGAGAGAVQQISSAGAGECLVSTAGAPIFTTCPGAGGVASIDGLTGVVTISNATGSGSNITIDDASTAQKGIAQFNSTNFSVASGVVNTIQGIATTSSPNFAGLTLGTALTVGNGGTGSTTAVGARSNLGAAASGANGDITSTTALNTLTPSGALTIGATGQSFLLQGTAASTLTATNAGSTTTIGFATPTANAIINFPALSAGTYTVCTSSGNCLGGSGGANTSLSNLASVAINTALLPGTTTIDIGSNANPFRDLYIGSAATNNFRLTGTASAARTITIPDATGTICLSTGNCVGGGGSAPSGADYLTLSLNASLTSERVLAAGTNISFNDAGANNNLTVSTVNNPTFSTSVTTPIVTSSGTLTITPAGDLTVGATGQKFTLQGMGTSTITATNGANVTTIGFATPTASSTLNFPALSAGTYTVCTSSNNCGAVTSVNTFNGAVVIQGTSNQVSVNNNSGTITLSTPQDINTSSSPTFAGLTLSAALTVGNGGTGATTAQGAINNISGLTTNGDLLYHNGTNAVRLPRGGNGECLLSNATTILWTTCPQDGVGDNISVNGSAATNADFLNTTASGTSTAVTWSLANGDEISIVIGNASATEAGSVTTGAQTFAGVKTFDDNIVLSAGDSLIITGSGTRPGSPVEGQIYYDTTTDSLLVYNAASAKWQANRTTTTKIVAANNSSQSAKDSADYVADGTGDQTEINNALTAAAGGTVYLMEGTYSVSATILVPNNTTLAGAGNATIIQLADLDASDNLIENSDVATGTGIVIRDLNLDGNDTANTGAITQHGIYLNNMGDGSGDSARQGAVITNIHAHDFESSAIYLNASDNNRITNNVAKGSGLNHSGISLNASHNNVITSNNSQGNSFSGISLSSSSANTVSGNQAENNGIGIYLASALNNTITGNTTQNNSNGIYLDSSSSYNTVSGNIMATNTTRGLRIVSNSQHNIVSGNSIRDNGGATANQGIEIDTDMNTITSNTITDSSCTSTCYAISIATNSDYNYLADNRYSVTAGSDQATIFDSGTNTRYASQMSPAQVLQSGSSVFKASSTIELTGDIDADGDTTPPGSGTKFLTELQVGDRIRLGAEERTVTVITDDTTITVDTAFSNLANDTTPERLPAALIVKNASGVNQLVVKDNGDVEIASGVLRVGSGSIATATAAGDLYIQDALEVDGEAVLTTVSGAGLTDCDNATISKLLWDSTAKTFSCGNDQDTDTGDDIFVNGAASTDADFLDTIASGTTAGVDFTLDNGFQIAATVSVASNTIAGVVTTGNQTFAGNKTFNGQVIGGAGLSVTGGSIDLNASSNNNTNINTGTSTGNVTIGNASAGTITVQSASSLAFTGTTTITGRLTVAGSSRFTASSSSTLTGTADPDGTTTLPGSGTLFLTELNIGDRITINAETRTVTAIASNLSLTVDTAFSNTASASVTRLPASLLVRNSSGTNQLVVKDNGDIEASAGLLKVGTGTANATATAAGDLYIQDALEVDGEAVFTTVSGAGLVDCDNGSTSKLLWDSGTKQFSCGTDAGGSGTGDNISVNGSDATDANFINTTASATTAGVTISLNTGANPDEVSITIGAASATEAGIITANSQTIGGDKTFNGLITGGAGLTVTGSTVSLNASSNNNTNINTGTSTGSIAIGNSAAGSVTIQSGSTIDLTGTTNITGRLTVAGSSRFTASGNSTLTGTADPDGTTTLPGSGTLFTSELNVGDRIIVNGETRTVTAIASDTSLTVDTAFGNTAAAAVTRRPASLIIRDASANNQVVVQDNGNIGIGTSAPGAWKVRIVNNTNWQLQLKSTDSGSVAATTYANDADVLFDVGITGSTHGTPNTGFMWQYGNYDIRFATNNAERIRIKNDGNVGIGQDTPGANRLVVNNQATTDNILSLQDNGASVLTVADGGALTMTGNFSQTGTTTFSTGSGNVSLNGDTTVASGKTLTVAGTTSINSTGSATTTIGSSAAGSISLQSNSTISLTAATNVTGRLTVAGSSTITASSTSTLTGTADPDGTTTLTGSSTLFSSELNVGDRITINAETRTVTVITSNTSLTVDTAFTDTASASITRRPASFIVKSSAGANQFLLQDNGNVGIGTATFGTYKVMIESGAWQLGIRSTVSNAVAATSFFNDNGVKFETGVTGSTHAGLTNSGYLWMYDNYDIRVATNNLERIRIKNDGNVGIGQDTPGANRLVVNNQTTTDNILNLQDNGVSVLTVADGGALTMTGNFSQTGPTTFGTGTGNVSLNGDVSVASGKTLTVVGTGATTLGGTLSVTGVTTLAKGTTADPGLVFNPTYDVGFTTGTSGGNADDALRAVANNAGANLQVQNTNAAGYSGVEYLNHSGAVGVFTGLNNSNGQEFRFNNIASGGYINFMIGGTTKLQVQNGGDVDVADNLKVGGTQRISQTGGLSNISGYSQSSGNFSQTGAGTFGTGTGAVSLNGDTTIASGKTLTVTSNASVGGTLGINTTSFGTATKLAVNAITTVDNAAATTISTGATTSKALVIQAAASQTARLQEWQTSNGAVMSFIDKDGKLGIGGVYNNEVYQHSGLHVKSPSANQWGVMIEANGNTSVMAAGHDGSKAIFASSYLGTGTYTPMEFQTNGSARIHIEVDGSVGIGTVSPGTARLAVSNEATTDDILHLYDNAVSVFSVADGGAVNATGSFTLGGTLALKKGTDYSTTGVSNAANLGAGSQIRLTGASAQTINGIDLGTDGRVLILVNAAGQSATIANNSGSASAEDRIITGSGSDLTLAAGASIQLVYDSGASLWRVVGSAGGGASGVTTVGTFSGSSQTDGATISGSTITFGPADGTNPGMVTTGAQTFAGVKTFSSAIVAPTSSDTINGLVVSAGSLSGIAGYSQSTGTFALSGGGNFSVDSAGFDVTTAGAISGVTTLNASGLVTSVGLTAGSGLIQGTGGLTITGTTDIGATAGNATSIGNATGTLTFTGSSSSTIVLNGTTVDATEFNYLDGHNAALIDINDAVNTAITGVGTLGSLTISGSGSFVVQKGTDFSATGNSDAASFTGSLIRLTGASTQTIRGITGASDGRVITLVNAASQAAIISNQHGTPSATERIITGTGADITLAPDASIELRYDATAQRWRVIGGVGGTSVTSVGTVSGTPTANGATITGNTLNLAVADGTNAGLVSTSAQTFGGDKTFTGLIQGSGGLTITGTTTIGATGGNTTSIGNATGTLTLTGSSSSTIVLNGTTISAAELNYLDGHDAALIDINDAVNTAITGVGTLGALTVSGNSSIGATAGNTTGIGNATGTLTVTGSSSSTFVLDGVTVSTAEFNLLDGHDAALIDTNDAVNTAITGVGTLGSLTVSGATTLNGAVTLGDATSDDIIFNGYIASNLLPKTNDTYDLGSDSLRWKDLYLGGETLHIGTNTSDEGAISYNTTTNTLSLQSTGTIALTSETSITGIANINTSGSAATTIGNTSGGAVSIQSGSTVGILTGTTGTGLTVGNTTSNPNIAFVGSGTFSTGTGAISVNGDTTVAAGKYLRVTGGNTLSRPAGSEGMIYYDTDTDQLLTYANGKWQGDRNGSTYLVAASDSSQAAKDAANYIADGEDSSGTGIGALDGDQIQINQALSAAGSTGGTVLLLKGTYTIDASISIPDNVTLVGEGNGSIVQFGNFGATATTLNAIVNANTASGKGISIRDFSLDGRKSINTNGTQIAVALSGLSGGTGTLTNTGVSISNLYVLNFRSYGVYVSNSSNVLLSENTLEGNSTNAIYLDGTSYARVSGNNIHGGGLSLDGASYNSSFNVISGNTIEGAAYGIFANSTSSNTIVSNVIRNNTIYGIWLASATLNNVSANVIDNNGGSTSNTGVYVFSSSNNSLTNNVITDSSCTSSCYAIHINATSSNNYLANNRYSTTAGSDKAIIHDLGTQTQYANQATPNGVLQSSSSLIKATSSSNLTGTGGITVATTTTLTGTSTKFNTELQVGDRITVNSQTRTITAITSDTTLTVDSAFTGGTWSGQTISRLPASLRVANSSGTNQLVINDSGEALLTGTYIQRSDSATAFRLQNSAGTQTNLLFDASAGQNELQIFEPGSATAYLRLYHESGKAIIASSNGTTQLGSGTGGNIELVLSNVADTLQASKGTVGSPIVLGAAYNNSDFTFTRSMTATTHNTSGNILRVEDLTTSTSGVNSSNVLYVNQSTAGTGNLILAQTGGSSDKFKVSTAGTVTIAAGQSYTGAGAVTLGSGAGTALTLTGNAASTWSTSSGALTITSAAAATWSTTTGNLTLSAGGTNTVIVKPGTDSQAAFKVQNAGATTDLFTVDTETATNPLRVQIGSSTTDATAVLGVLDSYNNGTDPTGIVGAMYYNTSLGKFRCYEGSAWVNCISAITSKFIVKGAGEDVTSSTALQDDNDLQFTMGAGETWVFEFRLLVYNNNDNGPDWKSAILASGAASCNVTMSGSEPQGAIFPQISTTDCTTPGTLINNNIVNDVDAFNVYIQGRVTDSGSGSTVKLQWAQNTLDTSALTVRGGSYVIAQKVGGN